MLLFSEIPTVVREENQVGIVCKVALLERLPNPADLFVGRGDTCEVGLNELGPLLVFCYPFVIPQARSFDILFATRFFLEIGKIIEIVFQNLGKRNLINRKAVEPLLSCIEWRVRTVETRAQ